MLKEMRRRMLIEIDMGYLNGVGLMGKCDWKGVSMEKSKEYSATVWIEEQKRFHTMKHLGCWSEVKVKL